VAKIEMKKSDTHQKEPTNEGTVSDESKSPDISPNTKTKRHASSSFSPALFSGDQESL